MSDRGNSKIGNGAKKKTARNRKEDTYQVGYCKPPRDTQFKSGESGNRRGRPKHRLNVYDSINRVLGSLTPITLKGKQRLVTRHEAILWKLFENASKGNVRAAVVLNQLAKESAPELAIEKLDFEKMSEKQLADLISRSEQLLEDSQDT